MGAAERHLRELALGQGFVTLRSLAQAADLDRHIVSEWMRGRTVPRRGALLRLAVALHVEPELLAQTFTMAREVRGQERSTGT
jgi:transcriptional regulator with XRE-family HTH domain